MIRWVQHWAFHLLHRFLPRANQSRGPGKRSACTSFPWVCPQDGGDSNGGDGGKSMSPLCPSHTLRLVMSFFLTARHSHDWGLCLMVTMPGSELSLDQTESLCKTHVYLTLDFYTHLQSSMRKKSQRKEHQTVKSEGIMGDLYCLFCSSVPSELSKMNMRCCCCMEKRLSPL